VKVEDYADWVAQLIRTLRLPASTTVLGNGFGGLVSTALAIRHGRLFGKLILADSLPAFAQPAKEPLRSTRRFPGAGTARRCSNPTRSSGASSRLRPS